MATWPNTTIDTTHFDEAIDDASQARAELEQMADNVNEMQAARGGTNGVASLDATGKMPTSELPIVPADKGGTGQQAYTVGDILYASTTGALNKLPAGTLGYVLKSNGPGAAPSWQQEGGGLVAGTRMIFQNTAAPVGWTKEVNSAYNDVALRIVTGTVGQGGNKDFSNVFVGSLGTSEHVVGGADTIGINAGGFGNPSKHTHTVALDVRYRDFILAQKD